MNVQRSAGLFLLGLAVLALFDFWFPGLLLLMGGVGLIVRPMHTQRRWAWALMGLGGLFWLRDGLQWLGWGAWFPLVMVVLGAALLAFADLQAAFGRDRDL